MGRMKIIVPLLVIGIFVLTSLARADTGTFFQIKERNEIRVGVRTNSPPFGFVDKEGESKGFDVDVTKMLARKLFGDSIAVRFVPVTAHNGIDLLNAGVVDIVVGPALTAEREREAQFTIPYFISGHLILERGDERPISLRDLAGKKVAVVKGSTSENILATLGATRVGFRTIGDAVGALRKGSVDAIVGQDEMLFAAEKEYPELMMADWRPFAVEQCCFAVRKGEVDWAGLASDGLRRSVKTSEFRGLLEKWFGLPRALLYERTLVSAMKSNRKPT